MGSLWLKIKVWTKAVLMVLFLLYLLLFIFNNANKEAHVWLWFGQEPQTSLLYVIFFTLVIGVVATLLTRVAFKTIRQIRDLQGRVRTEKLQRDVADMKAKASMLQTKPESPAPTDEVD
jgi:uncharacterized integral membrane protein